MGDDDHHPAPYLNRGKSTVLVRVVPKAASFPGSLTFSVPDLWRRTDRRKGSAVKVLTVIFVTAGVLYLLDSQYSGGRYLAMMTQMARHISAGFGFAW